MFEISIIIASSILLIVFIIWMVRDVKNIDKINKRLDEIQKDYKEIKEREKKVKEAMKYANMFDEKLMYGDMKERKKKNE